MIRSWSLRQRQATMDTMIQANMASGQCSDTTPIQRIYFVDKQNISSEIEYLDSIFLWSVVFLIMPTRISVLCVRSPLTRRYWSICCSDKVKQGSTELARPCAAFGSNQSWAPRRPLIVCNRSSESGLWRCFVLASSIWVEICHGVYICKGDTATEKGSFISKSSYFLSRVSGFW